jgi:hypothetical protein
MGSTPKSPAPPSFYSTMAGMKPGGAPPPGGAPAGPGAGGEEFGDKGMLIDKLMKVIEKMGKVDPDFAPYGQQMMDVAQKYSQEKLGNKPGAPGSEPPKPPDAAQPGSAGAGNPAADSQPVPA